MPYKSVLILLIFYVSSLLSIIVYRDEATLRKFIENIYEPKLAEICTIRAITEYNHASNKTDPRATEIMIKEMIAESTFVKEAWSNYFRLLNPAEFKDIDLQRKITRVLVGGNQVLDEERMKRVSNIINTMTSIGPLVRICPYTKQNCNNVTEGLRQNDLDEIMSKSTDYDELLYYWQQWHDKVGRKVKLYYPEYVKLSNDAACINNFTDKGAAWRFVYDTPNLEDFVDDLWTEVKPLYTELQIYVYNRLKRLYNGRNFNDQDKYIPAHLLGNMYAQSWRNIARFVVPFPNATTIDVTKELRDRNFTVLKMFEVADEFFQSLGLYSTKLAYNNTYIEQPKNTTVLCQPASWDYCNGKDFKITLCGRVTFKDFVTIHHEMGHIEYYMLYRKQPTLFRAGANPAFHEAVGETIALSVSTPKHLQKIGLLGNYVETKETDLNDLMNTALDKVAFLPYSYIVDKWRWDIFKGKATSEYWNKHYWNYRRIIQRIKPPIDRSDKIDFDGGAKFHVAADTQYISYFIAHMLQFQFHRGLCIAAGQYQPGNENMPLHKCDIYNSKEAGAKLRKALSLGYSKPWPDVLEILTGERKLSGKALLEYFQPLMKFLEQENKKLKT